MTGIEEKKEKELIGKEGRSRWVVRRVATDAIRRNRRLRDPASLASIFPRLNPVVGYVRSFNPPSLEIPPTE